MKEFAGLIAEENPPSANSMINTFRAFGYNLEMAVADIIDNSISANARNVWVEFSWFGKNSSITIHDDGIGMNIDELRNAMKPGSKDPNDERDLDDLGRFGLGLKTASFSQCKRLTVVSKKAGFTVQKRCWDLDYVNEVQSWSMLDFVSDQKFLEPLTDPVSGTIVVWEKLDRLVGDAQKEDQSAKEAFFQRISDLEKHLSLVFHRYIEKNKVTIFLNGNKVQPWDPFLKAFDGGQLIASEELAAGKVQVKCFVLPHSSNLPADEKHTFRLDEWHALQGFYVYRNHRLLLHANWLGMGPKNEHHKNARILIDIPNELDHEWKIDIKKATASPPLRLRKDLKRLSIMTRKAAGEVYRFRGNQIRLRDTNNRLPYQSVWKSKKDRGGGIDYFVNEEHSIVKAILESDTISKKNVKELIQLIGQTTPVESIILNYSEDPESHEMRSSNTELTNTHRELAKMIFDGLIKQGYSRENAIKFVLNTEPLDTYPELAEELQ